MFISKVSLLTVFFLLFFNLVIFWLLEGEQETARSTSAQAPETEDLKWFYQGRNGWWEYDERTTAELEEAYKDALKAISSEEAEQETSAETAKSAMELMQASADEFAAAWKAGESAEKNEGLGKKGSRPEGSSKSSIVHLFLSTS